MDSRPDDIPSGIPAPYGRSCEECARAKSKCILRPSGESCIRCYRLSRNCRPSTSKRKRRGKDNLAHSQSIRIDDDTNRTARLEQKLDEIVASIKRHPVAIASPPIPENDSPAKDPTSNNANTCVQHEVPSALGVNFPVAFSNHTSPSRSVLRSPSWGAGGVSSDEADEYLTIFKIYHSRYFPFVHIEASTAAELRIQRPYLWLAILTTGSYSVSRQQRLGELFRREIAEAIVVRSEKSIDLLLGLLTFIGWFHNQFKAENGAPKTSLSMLTQLAISIVFDLHLSKPAAVMDPRHSLGVRYHNHPDHPRRLTIEEMRAVLGCFLVTSIISNYLQKTDALRWTPQLEDCLRQLSDKPEWEGDEILVQHVRMQLVVEKIELCRWYDSGIGLSGRLCVPSSLVFQTSFAQLEQIKNNLPAHLHGSNIILAHLVSSELSIAEIALWQTSAERDQLGSTRQKYLFACLSSAKAWLEIFQSCSITEYLAFPFSFASQSTRCLGVLLYLYTLEESGWDKEFAKKEVDLVGTMDAMVARLEQSIASMQNDGDEDIFSRHCNFWKSIRPSIVARLASQEDSTDDLVAQAFGTDGSFGDFFDWNIFYNEWLSSMS